MDHTQGCVCMRVHPFGSESRSVYDGCTIHMCNLSYAVFVSSIFQLNIPPPPPVWGWGEYSTLYTPAIFCI